MGAHVVLKPIYTFLHFWAIPVVPAANSIENDASRTIKDAEWSLSSLDKTCSPCFPKRFVCTQTSSPLCLSPDLRDDGGV